jgi:predicted TIM-barrel fold metal-dependent hydrolase
VTIVLGTRPEAIKLAPVILAFQASSAFRTRVVLTGQHREMVSQVMELFDLRADHDLALDVNHGRVLEAVALLAERLPRLRIVIDHMAGARISTAGPEAAWRDAIRGVARHENVFMKVSALAELAAGAAGPAGPPTDPAFYTPWLETVWGAFGPGRLLYGSNWPVSDRATGYANVLGIVAPFVRAAGPAAERSFFHDASQAAYRWVAPA